MPRLSSGLLLFRRRERRLEVLLVHPGGPFWRRRDTGGWSLPKGEHEPNEDSLSAARREFAEELGLPPPAGEAIELGAVKQPSGKLIHAWALAADIDVSQIQSNSFELEWPPGSGELRQFPEADRAAWFDLSSAREKMIAGQRPLLDLLLERVGA